MAAMAPALLPARTKPCTRKARAMPMARPAATIPPPGRKGRATTTTPAVIIPPRQKPRMAMFMQAIMAMCTSIRIAAGPNGIITAAALSPFRRQRTQPVSPAQRKIISTRQAQVALLPVQAGQASRNLIQVTAAARPPAMISARCSTTSRRARAASNGKAASAVVEDLAAAGLVAGALVVAAAVKAGFLNLSHFDSICKRLPGAAMVIQWGESHVWKVGGKMFGLGNVDSDAPAYVFKTSPLSFEILLSQGIATRAPYLPRGNWVRVLGNALPEADLTACIRQSYEIIAAKLPKAVRRELALI